MSVPVCQSGSGSTPPPPISSTKVARLMEGAAGFDVLQQILGYANGEQLLSLRLVSSTWNEVACSLLRLRSRRNSKTLNFSTRNQRKSFTSILQGRNEASPLPFPPSIRLEFGFYLYDKHEDDEFAVAIGSVFTHYMIHIDCTCHESFLDDNCVLETMLSRAPNLERLDIFASGIDYFSIGDSGVVKPFELPMLLPQLRSLNVIPWYETDEHSKDFRREEANSYEDIFQTWTFLAPGLIEFNCQLRIHMEQEPNLPQMIQSLGHINFVSLSIVITMKESAKGIIEELIQEMIQDERKRRVHQLRLEIRDMDPEESHCLLVSQLVDSMAGTLKNLTVVLESAKNPGLVLRRPQSTLTNLRINFFEDKDKEPDPDLSRHVNVERFRNVLQPGQFPVLRSVTLENFKPKLEGSIFSTSASFSTVQDLNLKNYSLQEAPLVTWNHYSFPNLTSLRMEGVVVTKHQLDYVISHYQQTLVHLHLRHLEIQKGYFQVLTGGLAVTEVDWGDDDEGRSISLKSSSLSADHNWEFPLKKLKTLELFGLKMKKICLALLYLTATKRIQRLDYLGLLGVKREGLIRIETFDRLKWHKEVMLKGSCMDFSKEDYDGEELKDWLLDT